MTDRPGFFERVARKEYDNPLGLNLATLGVVALVSLAFADGWLALTLAMIICIGTWGTRRDGYLRRRMQRKYGWTDDETVQG